MPKYVLEILTYRGWVPDTDEDGRVLVFDRQQARKVLAQARENSAIYRHVHNRYRIRIVNEPARPNRKKRQEAKRRWVTDYRTDRSFGGPEEGGWWYDTGEPVPGTCRSFYNEDNARFYADRNDELAAEFNKSRGSRGDISSVICDYALRTFVERHPPRVFPAQRPYYC